MKPYMKRFEAYLTEQLQNPVPDQIPELRKEVLVQIGFMQHERLIHFLVTMLFAILFLISLGILLFSPSIGMILLTLLLLGLLVPYIAHYYFLENTVQKFYVLYNALAAMEDDIQYPNTDPEQKC